MPAKSAAHQKAAGAALAAKRGKTSVSKLRGASKSMYKSMSERQLDEFASTKRRGEPAHAAKSRSAAKKAPARRSSSGKRSR
jgi:putative salt-induced outer membrane protein YdiY